MDLRQLRTFVHVAELGTFSKAAQRLRIAQPALSRQIRLLEAELKTALFERNGRGVRLTSAGELLQAHALGVLRQLEQARAEVMREASTIAGQVALGMPPSVGLLLTGPLVERFHALYPGVSLRIVEAVGAYVFDLMMAGRLDVGVLYDPHVTTALQLTPLWSEDLHLVGPASARLRRKKPVPFQRLGAVPLVLPGVGHGLRGLIEGHARRVGVTLTIKIEADAMRIQKDLVARGIGYTALPFAAVEAEIKAGNLTSAPIIEPRVERRLALAFPTDRPVSRAARLLGEHIRDVAREMAEGGRWPGMNSLAEPAP